MFQSNSRHRRVWRAGTLSIMACLTIAGCSWSWARLPAVKNPFASAPPCVLSPAATKEDIITHLNANISRLTSWRSTRVGIHLSQRGGLPMDVNANIAVKSPNHFRLRASSILGEEADFGSNDERFWFWVKRSDQPHVFTAEHSQMHVAQQRLPFPFQPQWMMEALGVSMLNPDEFHLVPVSETRANLVKDVLSATGAPLQKVVSVDLCRGHIIEHTLLDSQGIVIARATMGDYRTGTEGIAVPYLITLAWPQAGMSMRMNMLDIELNPPHTPDQIWELPTTLGQVYDIGR